MNNRRENEQSILQSMDNTFPKLLLRNYRQWGDTRVALRKKEYGIWKEYTWKECYEKVKAIFLGLVSVGLEAGDKVSILGDNNPEWFWSELAVQSAGGIALGLNPGSSPQEAKYVLEDSQSKLVLVQDQEQVDKLLEINDELPLLQRIVYWNDKGLRHYDDAILVSLAEVIRLGEEHEKSHPGHFEQNLAVGKGDDLAMILYTLGSNGLPKALPATYQFLLSSLESALASNPAYDSDEYVSVITPGWFFEQVLGFAACLVTGQRLNFIERPETAPEDSREISPHILVYPSPVWDQIASAIETNVGSGTWLKRTLYHRSLSLGYDRADLSSSGGQMNIFKRLLHPIAGLVVFRPLKDKHGLNRARVIYAAGSVLPPQTTRFFAAIGVNLRQIFASTEGGVVSVHPGDDVNIQ